MLQRAGGFEDAVKLEQAVGHHSEVGHHDFLAEKFSERQHHLGSFGVLAVNDFVELALGLFAPMPRIFKRRDLRLALVALGRFEEEIVVALGVERRIEVDEVNGFGRKVLAHHLKVVAEVELVHAKEFYSVRATAATKS